MIALSSLTLPPDCKKKLTSQGLSPINTMTSAFFYGILIHPKILKRALNNDASHLRFSPAILTVGPFPT